MKKTNKIMPYLNELKRLIEEVIVYGRKMKVVDFEASVLKVCKLVLSAKKDNTVFFIGNGGSASIASHMATDFLKNGDMRVLAFNDPSLLTCISNDLGYEMVFAKPISRFAKKNDILFAISSSGESANILRAVEAARKRGCFIITLSGFSSDNRLSKKGDLNFYVSSKLYSHVEIMHLALCHYIADIVISQL